MVTTEAAAAAGILAATADLPSAALPTPRRQEAARIQTNRRILKEHAVGTDSSETKAANASLIAQSLKLFKPT